MTGNHEEAEIVINTEDGDSYSFLVTPHFWRGERPLHAEADSLLRLIQLLDPKFAEFEVW